MKKGWIASLGALLLGLVAGTGWVTMQGKGAGTEVGADSVAAVGSAAVDSGTVEAEVRRSEPVDSAEGATHPTATDSARETEPSAAGEADADAGDAAGQPAAERTGARSGSAGAEENGSPKAVGGGEPGGAGTSPPDSVASAGEVRDKGALRLSRIITEMRARDAAAVLSELDHDEIERILRHLGERQTAEILTQLDPERAAALSRVLIEGDGDGGEDGGREVPGDGARGGGAR